MEISLVGAGYWGSKLKAELETIPGVEEIEIIDIKDGKDLKDIKYDNVILATPAWDHHTQTIRLLQQDKNVYVEKPLSLTCTECCIIKSFLREQTLMVGHIFLYNDRVHKIKEQLLLTETQTKQLKDKARFYRLRNGSHSLPIIKYDNPSSKLERKRLFKDICEVLTK